MSALGEAIQISHAGDRAHAAELFFALWERVGDQGDALHRMSIAHFMADVQDDVQDELTWDLRALDAAHEVTEEQVRAAGMPGPVRALFPSLHLNLGECYRKHGDLAEARRHLTLGQAASAALGDDGYSMMIRRGLDGLAERLGA